MGHTIFLAAAGMTGRRFGVLVASSLIATSVIVSAALTAGGHGPFAALLGTAAAQPAASDGAPTASDGVSPPPPPKTASTKSAPPSAPAPRQSAPPPTAPPPSTPPPKHQQKPPKNPTNPTAPPAKLGRVKHVFVISLSSPGYDQTWGADSKRAKSKRAGSEMPYLADTLRPKGELLYNYSLLTESGLPNDIAMVSGQPPNKLTTANCPKFSEFKVGTLPDQYGLVNGPGCVYPAQAITIADQVFAGGLSWRAYAEDMADESGPHACVHPGPEEADNPVKGGYATRLNPFAYFHALLDLGSCAVNDIPLAGIPDLSIPGLQDDLQKASTTPNYAFISPNLCHDGIPGQCPAGDPDGAAAADAFLAEWVPRILDSPAYREGAAVIITFGESHAPKGTDDPLRVGTLVLSKYLKGGSTDGIGYTPYSLLRSVEDMFSALHLGYANAVDGVSFASPLLGSKG